MNEKKPEGIGIGDIVNELGTYTNDRITFIGAPVEINEKNILEEVLKYCDHDKEALVELYHEYFEKREM